MINYLFPGEENVEGNVVSITRNQKKKKKAIDAANAVLDASLSDDVIERHFQLTLKDATQKVLCSKG